MSNSTVGSHSPAPGADWVVPTPERPVDATVRVPGSKSITNRAYVLAALSSTATLVRHPLDSRDARLMTDALGVLGARSEHTDTGVRIHPLEPRRCPDPAEIALGNSGTVARFTPPLAALGPATVRFDGDPPLRRRPMAGVLRALRDLGVDIDDGGDPAPPFTVRGAGSVRGGVVDVDASASSQFLSALLLAGPAFAEGITARLVGSSPPSGPHIAMTLDLLRTFGADPSRDGNEFHVPPATLGCPDYTVEPDLSSAAPFLLAAALTGGSVRVLDWPASTTQPGDWVRSLLTELGVSVTTDERGVTATGSGELPGVELDLHDVSELTPVVAAMLCFAAEPSTIRGVAHLRGHETDRLAALAAELSGLGGRVTETEDGLRIVPSPMRSGTFHTYDDHRLVMAAALIGLRVPGVAIENPATVGKTFPGFVEAWSGMLGA
ncbi:3-phosphoshikimate 1-carboxyvinyltransferase [Haloechinothrix sp. YIM 98757]|uniref:3-phosphoshikimate 1-carboxyvinyltransferase n=1 Tax=Haloechinothrix aidingensis TaxID=2752311 RepID=A0A838AGR4_9PSEU|nr:3-phosphoshikimate 1-carboxyvinyltransferase [Haloechinothrix aidingensis]